MAAALYSLDQKIIGPNGLQFAGVVVQRESDSPRKFSFVITMKDGGTITKTLTFEELFSAKKIDLTLPSGASYESVVALFQRAYFEYYSSHGAVCNPDGTIDKKNSSSFSEPALSLVTDAGYKLVSQSDETLLADDAGLKTIMGWFNDKMTLEDIQIIIAGTQFGDMEGLKSAIIAMVQKYLGKTLDSADYTSWETVINRLVGENVLMLQNVIEYRMNESKLPHFEPIPGKTADPNAITWAVLYGLEPNRAALNSAPAFYMAINPGEKGTVMVRTTYAPSFTTYEEFTQWQAQRPSSSILPHADERKDNTIDRVIGGAGILPVGMQLKGLFDLGKMAVDLFVPKSQGDGVDAELYQSQEQKDFQQQQNFFESQLAKFLGLVLVPGFSVILAQMMADMNVGSFSDKAEWYDVLIQLASLLILEIAKAQVLRNIIGGIAQKNNPVLKYDRESREIRVVCDDGTTFTVSRLIGDKFDLTLTLRGKQPMAIGTQRRMVLEELQRVQAYADTQKFDFTRVQVFDPFLSSEKIGGSVRSEAELMALAKTEWDARYQVWQEAMKMDMAEGRDTPSARTKRMEAWLKRDIVLSRREHYLTEKLSVATSRSRDKMTGGKLMLSFLGGMYGWSPKFLRRYTTIGYFISQKGPDSYASDIPQDFIVQPSVIFGDKGVEPVFTITKEMVADRVAGMTDLPEVISRKLQTVKTMEELLKLLATDEMKPYAEKIQLEFSDLIDIYRSNVTLQATAERFKAFVEAGIKEKNPAFAKYEIKDGMVWVETIDEVGNKQKMPVVGYEFAPEGGSATYGFIKNQGEKGTQQIVLQLPRELMEMADQGKFMEALDTTLSKTIDDLSGISFQKDPLPATEKRLTDKYSPEVAKFCVTAGLDKLPASYAAQLAEFVDGYMKEKGSLPTKAACLDFLADKLNSDIFGGTLNAAGKKLLAQHLEQLVGFPGIKTMAKDDFNRFVRLLIEEKIPLNEKDIKQRTAVYLQTMVRASTERIRYESMSSDERALSAITDMKGKGLVTAVTVSRNGLNIECSIDGKKQVVSVVFEKNGDVFRSVYFLEGKQVPATDIPETLYRTLEPLTRTTLPYFFEKDCLTNAVGEKEVISLTSESIPLVTKDIYKRVSSYMFNTFYGAKVTEVDGFESWGTKEKPGLFRQTNEALKTRMAEIEKQIQDNPAQKDKLVLEYTAIWREMMWRADINVGTTDKPIYVSSLTEAEFDKMVASEAVLTCRFSDPDIIAQLKAGRPLSDILFEKQPDVYSKLEELKMPKTFIDRVKADGRFADFFITKGTGKDKKVFIDPGLSLQDLVDAEKEANTPEEKAFIGDLRAVWDAVMGKKQNSGFSGRRLRDSQISAGLMMADGHVVNVPCGGGKTEICRITAMLQLARGKSALITSPTDDLVKSQASDVLFNRALTALGKPKAFAFDYHRYQSEGSSYEYFAEKGPRIVYMQQNDAGFLTMGSEDKGIYLNADIDMREFFLIVDEIDDWKVHSGQTPLKISTAAEGELDKTTYSCLEEYGKIVTGKLMIDLGSGKQFTRLGEGRYQVDAGKVKCQVVYTESGVLAKVIVIDERGLRTTYSGSDAVQEFKSKTGIDLAGPEYTAAKITADDNAEKYIATTCDSDGRITGWQPGSEWQSLVAEAMKGSEVAKAIEAEGKAHPEIKNWLETARQVVQYELEQAVNARTTNKLGVDYRVETIDGKKKIVIVHAQSDKGEPSSTFENPYARYSFSGGIQLALEAKEGFKRTECTPKSPSDGGSEKLVSIVMDFYARNGGMAGCSGTASVVRETFLQFNKIVIDMQTEYANKVEMAHRFFYTTEGKDAEIKKFMADTYFSKEWKTNGCDHPVIVYAADPTKVAMWQKELEILNSGLPEGQKRKVITLSSDKSVDEIIKAIKAASDNNAVLIFSDAGGRGTDYFSSYNKIIEDLSRLPEAERQAKLESMSKSALDGYYTTYVESERARALDAAKEKYSKEHKGSAMKPEDVELFNSNYKPAMSRASWDANPHDKEILAWVERQRQTMSGSDGVKFGEEFERAVAYYETCAEVLKKIRSGEMKPADLEIKKPIDLVATEASPHGEFVFTQIKGRVGRGGLEGKSFVFVSLQDTAISKYAGFLSYAVDEQKLAGEITDPEMTKATRALLDACEDAGTHQAILAAAGDEFLRYLQIEGQKFKEVLAYDFRTIQDFEKTFKDMRTETLRDLCAARDAKRISSEQFWREVEKTYGLKNISEIMGEDKEKLSFEAIAQKAESAHLATYGRFVDSVDMSTTLKSFVEVTYAYNQKLKGLTKEYLDRLREVDSHSPNVEYKKQQIVQEYIAKIGELKRSMAENVCTMKLEFAKTGEIVHADFGSWTVSHERIVAGRGKSQKITDRYTLTPPKELGVKPLVSDSMDELQKYYSSWKDVVPVTNADEVKTFADTLPGKEFPIFVFEHNGGRTAIVPEKANCFDVDGIVKTEDLGRLYVVLESYQNGLYHDVNKTQLTACSKELVGLGYDKAAILALAKSNPAFVVFLDSVAFTYPGNKGLIEKLLATGPEGVMKIQALVSAGDVSYTKAFLDYAQAKAVTFAGYRSGSSVVAHFHPHGELVLSAMDKAFGSPAFVFGAVDGSPVIRMAIPDASERVGDFGLASRGPLTAEIEKTVTAHLEALVILDAKAMAEDAARVKETMDGKIRIGDKLMTYQEALDALTKLAVANPDQLIKTQSFFIVTTYIDRSDYDACKVYFDFYKKLEANTQGLGGSITAELLQKGMQDLFSEYAEVLKSGDSAKITAWMEQAKISVGGGQTIPFSNIFSGISQEDRIAFLNGSLEQKFFTAQAKINRAFTDANPHMAGLSFPELFRFIERQGVDVSGRINGGYMIDGEIKVSEARQMALEGSGKTLTFDTTKDFDRLPQGVKGMYGDQTISIQSSKVSINGSISKQDALKVLVGSASISAYFDALVQKYADEGKVIDQAELVKQKQLLLEGKITGITITVINGASRTPETVAIPKSIIDVAKEYGAASKRVLAVCGFVAADNITEQEKQAFIERYCDSLVATDGSRNTAELKMLVDRILAGNADALRVAVDKIDGAYVPGKDAAYYVREDSMTVRQIAAAYPDKFVAVDLRDAAGNPTYRTVLLTITEFEKLKAAKTSAKLAEVEALLKSKAGMDVAFDPKATIGKVIEEEDFKQTMTAVKTEYVQKLYQDLMAEHAKYLIEVQKVPSDQFIIEMNKFRDTTLQKILSKYDDYAKKLICEKYYTTKDFSFSPAELRGIYESAYKQFPASIASKDLKVVEDYLAKIKEPFDSVIPGGKPDDTVRTRLANNILYMNDPQAMEKRIKLEAQGTGWSKFRIFLQEGKLLVEHYPELVQYSPVKSALGMLPGTLLSSIIISGVQQLVKIGVDLFDGDGKFDILQHGKEFGTSVANFTMMRTASTVLESVMGYSKFSSSFLSPGAMGMYLYYPFMLGNQRYIDAETDARKTFAISATILWMEDFAMPLFNKLVVKGGTTIIPKTGLLGAKAQKFFGGNVGQGVTMGLVFLAGTAVLSWFETTPLYESMVKDPVGQKVIYGFNLAVVGLMLKDGIMAFATGAISTGAGAALGVVNIALLTINATNIVAKMVRNEFENLAFDAYMQDRFKEMAETPFLTALSGGYDMAANMVGIKPSTFNTIMFLGAGTYALGEVLGINAFSHNIDCLFHPEKALYDQVSYFLAGPDKIIDSTAQYFLSMYDKSIDAGRSAPTEKSPLFKKPATTDAYIATPFANADLGKMLPELLYLVKARELLRKQREDAGALKATDFLSGPFGPLILPAIRKSEIPADEAYLKAKVHENQVAFLKMMGTMDFLTYAGMSQADTIIGVTPVHQQFALWITRLDLSVPEKDLLSRMLFGRPYNSEELFKQSVASYAKNLTAIPSDALASCQQELIDGMTAIYTIIKQRQGKGYAGDAALQDMQQVSAALYLNQILVNAGKFASEDKTEDAVMGYLKIRKTLVASTGKESVSDYPIDILVRFLQDPSRISLEMYAQGSVDPDLAGDAIIERRMERLLEIINMQMAGGYEPTKEDKDAGLFDPGTGAVTDLKGWKDFYAKQKESLLASIDLIERGYKLDKTRSEYEYELSVVLAIQKKLDTDVVNTQMKDLARQFISSWKEIYHIEKKENAIALLMDIYLQKKPSYIIAEYKAILAEHGVVIDAKTDALLSGLSAAYWSTYSSAKGTPEVIKLIRDTAMMIIQPSFAEIVEAGFKPYVKPVIVKIPELSFLPGVEKIGVSGSSYKVDATTKVVYFWEKDASPAGYVKSESYVYDVKANKIVLAPTAKLVPLSKPLNDVVDITGARFPVGHAEYDDSVAMSIPTDVMHYFEDNEAEIRKAFPSETGALTGRVFYQIVKKGEVLYLRVTLQKKGSFELDPASFKDFALPDNTVIKEALLKGIIQGGLHRVLPGKLVSGGYVGLDRAQYEVFRVDGKEVVYKKGAYSYEKSELFVFGEDCTLHVNAAKYKPVVAFLPAKDPQYTVTVDSDTINKTGYFNLGKNYLIDSGIVKKDEKITEAKVIVYKDGSVYVTVKVDRQAFKGSATMISETRVYRLPDNDLVEYMLAKNAIDAKGVVTIPTSPVATESGWTVGGIYEQSKSQVTSNGSGATIRWMKAPSNRMDIKIGGVWYQGEYVGGNSNCWRVYVNGKAYYIGNYAAAGATGQAEVQATSWYKGSGLKFTSATGWYVIEAKM
jgi:preprotein translocase subunit SecA